MNSVAATIKRQRELEAMPMAKHAHVEFNRLELVPNLGQQIVPDAFGPGLDAHRFPDGSMGMQDEAGKFFAMELA